MKEICTSVQSSTVRRFSANWSDIGGLFDGLVVDQNEKGQSLHALTCDFVVGVTRFELVTSSVSGKRSPPELNARVLFSGSYTTMPGAICQREFFNFLKYDAVMKTTRPMTYGGARRYPS